MTKTTKPKIIVILGPTAVGKSDLAVELARRFNGEIVSADSRQVYEGMDIGTGKIMKKEMKGVPHHLLDVASLSANSGADPKRKFDVAKYRKLAIKATKQILKKGKLPIICGGTGLYIKAIVDNPSYPSVRPDAKLRQKLEKLSTADLFKRLKKLDSERAKTIDSKNPRRLVRALEIVIKSGKRITEIKNNPLFDSLQIGIVIPPKKIKEKIKIRLQKRIRSGMIEEVKKLNKKGISFKRLYELGLEYRWVAFLLQNEISKKEMAEELNNAIWQYAKRQMTWFKKDQRIVWISEISPKQREKQATKLIEKFLA